MAITETRTRPPQFIEDIGVDLANQLQTLQQDKRQLEPLKLDNKV
jgi:hypothetical protein